MQNHIAYASAVSLLHSSVSDGSGKALELGAFPPISRCGSMLVGSLALPSERPKSKLRVPHTTFSITADWPVPASLKERSCQRPAEARADGSRAGRAASGCKSHATWQSSHSLEEVCAAAIRFPLEVAGPLPLSDSLTAQADFSLAF